MLLVDSLGRAERALRAPGRGWAGPATFVAATGLLHLSACERGPSPEPAASARAGASASASASATASASAGPNASADPLAAEIEKQLPARSYLEERCEPIAPIADVPAKRCRYRPKGAEVTVDIAVVPRETLARWIVDAARADPRSKNDAEARAAALALTSYVVAQSSGAIPLGGDVWEDLSGDGVGVLYPFDRGVSLKSGTCRPMSLTAREWCMGQADPAACEREDHAQRCARWLSEGLATGVHAGLRARARLMKAPATPAGPAGAPAVSTDPADL
jgi:hypothetical protein